MSRGERVEVMGRVATEELKLTDAAAVLQHGNVEFPIVANPRNFGTGC
jgi:hypothetical protein